MRSLSCGRSEPPVVEDAVVAGRDAESAGIVSQCARHVGLTGSRGTPDEDVRIPTMPITSSGKPITDSGACRSPWRSGGP